MVVEKITPEQLLKILDMPTAVEVLKEELLVNTNINSSIFYTLRAIDNWCVANMPTGIK